MPTFQHLLVARHRGQRVAPKGLKATAEWLDFSSFTRRATHEADDGWTTYTLGPGPYAHNLFVEGEAPSDSPAFELMTISAGDTARPLQLGDEASAVYFFVRIDGCCFERPLDELADRLHQIMVVRTETFSTPEA